MSDEKAQKVIDAANLLREHGYAIVTQTEKEMWDRWLHESHERERQSHDEIQRLIWQYGGLLERITKLLAPSRPRWLRAERSWWNCYGWTEPIVFDREPIR